MHHLQLVGVHEDGEHLLLASREDPRTYALRIDDALRSAIRWEASHPVAGWPRPTDPMSPVEVQAMIRAGATSQEAAERAHWTVDKVRRYEGPILAEREHIARLAADSRLRPRGLATDSPTLRERVERRLADRGVDIERLDWDSWRNDDGQWTVELHFVEDGAHRTAAWHFTKSSMLLHPLDPDADTLTDDEELAPLSHVVSGGYRSPSSVESFDAARHAPEPPPADPDPPSSPPDADGDGELMDAMRERSRVRTRRRGTRRAPAPSAPVPPPVVEEPGPPARVGTLPMGPGPLSGDDPSVVEAFAVASLPPPADLPHDELLPDAPEPVADAEPGDAPATPTPETPEAPETSEAAEAPELTQAPEATKVAQAAGAAESAAGEAAGPPETTTPGDAAAPVEPDAAAQPEGRPERVESAVSPAPGPPTESAGPAESVEVVEAAQPVDAATPGGGLTPTATDATDVTETPQPEPASDDPTSAGEPSAGPTDGGGPDASASPPPPTSDAPPTSVEPHLPLGEPDRAVAPPQPEAGTATPQTDSPGPAPEAAPKPGPRPGGQRQQPASKQRAKNRRNRGRASVPAWDDIVFGAKPGDEG